MPRNIPIQLRRGTSTEWINENPVLISGEPGFDTQINSLKIGDGSTPYNNLPILFSGIYLQNIIEDNSPTLGNNLALNTYDIIGTGNIDIIGDITADSGNFNQIIFNTGLEDPNLLAGQLQWNATEGTLDLGLNENYAMHLGEELLYRVRNVTGSTILAGQPVYASGLSPGANNRIEVALYAADGTIREIRFMGLITEDLTDNGNNGFATQFGYIRGVDTRGDAATYGTTDKLWTSGEPAWNEGDILYVHPSVPGKLTKIEPKHSISVAIITSKGSNGKLFVRPTSYGHLDDNHDVAVSGATNGQFLQYNSVTDYWVPSSSGNFTTLQVNGTGVSVSGHVHTTGDISNFASGVADVISRNLLPGTGIIFDYDSEADTLTVNNSRPLSKTINVFTPALNQPPATGFATIDTRNSILVLDFDDGADNEAAIFVGVIPDGMSTASGIYANIYWTATTATSGQCRWGVAFEKTDGDIDTDDFDTATEDHTTVNSTNGIPTKTTILCTNIDNLIANDMFRLKIYRDSSDTTNDTLVGDVELIAVELQTVN